MQTQEMISIKVSNQTEIRRFAIPVRSSFETLESSVRSMFKITGPTIIKYTDDEGDLCTITTQPELDFAVTLNPNLLRLSITVPNVIALVPLVRAAPVAQQQTPVKTTDCQAPHPMHQKWAEILERKTAHLTEKQQRLQTKVAETEDPERKRFLNSKLERVQQKLAFFEARKQCMSQGPQHNQERPWRAHGGQQRGCWKRENNQQFDGKTMPEHPFHYPHRMMHHPHHQQFPKDQQEREQRWIGFLEKRTQALNEKRESIQLKLAGENLTPERRRFLEEKLGRIQQKLVNMENKKQHLSQQQSGQENSHPCKGRGRRCGRFSECQKNPETQ